MRSKEQFTVTDIENKDPRQSPIHTAEMLTELWLLRV